MKILVCIKQVPDMESRFTINAEGTWYSEADLAWRMNEYDEYAVEQAVQLKESLGGDAQICVLSIGPDRTKESIKKALAMGADTAVHIKDDASYRKTPLEIATLIHACAMDEGYDLIFTGMQSQDRGSAQVGVLLGEMLGIATVSTIVNFAFDKGQIQVKRELEGGTKAAVTMQTPALVTCQLGLNTPRYPTLPNIMKAKKKELKTVEAEGLAQATPITKTEKMYVPEKKGGGMVLEGDVESLTKQLIGILKEKTTVLK